MPGLALMQNKVGKGFNVGNILSSVGEAGAAAQPLMIQAKKKPVQHSFLVANTLWSNARQRRQIVKLLESERDS